MALQDNIEVTDKKQGQQNSSFVQKQCHGVRANGLVMGRVIDRLVAACENAWSLQLFSFGRGSERVMWK